MFRNRVSTRVRLTITAGLLCGMKCATATQRYPASLSPEAALLRSIAEGRRDAATLAKHVRECVQGSARTVGCEEKVGLVLAALVAEDPEARHVVVEAVATGSVEPNGSFQTERLGRIRIRADQPWRDASSSARGASTTAQVEPDLTKEEIDKYGKSRAVRERFERVVATRIDGDVKRRVRVAFENAQVADCNDVLGGQMKTTCERLPGGGMQAALWGVGLGPIWQGICDEDVADIYSALGRGELERASSAIAASGNEYLLDYGVLLRKWARKAPTKWQAWADAAELAAW